MKTTICMPKTTSGTDRPEPKLLLQLEMHGNWQEEGNMVVTCMDIHESDNSDEDEVFIKTLFKAEHYSLKGIVFHFSLLSQLSLQPHISWVLLTFKSSKYLTEEVLSECGCLSYIAVLLICNEIFNFLWLFGEGC